MTAVPHTDACLAEFAALRQEIDDRKKARQQILSLQVTAMAAVFGFALSRPNLTPLLLGIPFISYLFCSRLVSQHIATLIAGQYIREELSPRVPGGLGWEDWILRHGRRRLLQEPVLPLLMTFPLPAIVAVIWSAWFAFTDDSIGTVAAVGFVIGSVIGAGVTTVSVILVIGIPDGSRAAALQNLLIGWWRSTP